MWNFWKRASKEKKSSKVEAKGEYSVYIPEESFVTATADMDGKPYVCVLNRSLLDVTPKEVFRWYLSIIFRYENTVGDEMPDNEMTEVMQNFTDYLHDYLAVDKAHPNALFLGRVTGGGKTQVMWYVNNPEMANEQLQDMIDSGRYSLHFEYVMHEDPDFKEAHWWLDSLK